MIIYHSRKYSAQGQEGNLHSYHYKHKVGEDQFSFIAADATLVPGPKRPFNFFGYVPEVWFYQYLHCTFFGYFDLIHGYFDLIHWQKMCFSL